MEHYVTSSVDTKCFYFFTDNHKEEYTKRVPCLGRFSLPGAAWTDLHTSKPNFSKWSPPNYKEYYSGRLNFKTEQPIVIVTNKRYDPPGRMYQGTFSNRDLELLFSYLTGRYVVIYNRPLPGMITEDHQAANVDKSDFEICSKFGVLTSDKLYNIAYPKREKTFNTFQCEMYANCERFITVQGGSSILGSYFGGTNLIYAADGQELKVGSYDLWYDKLSGCNVKHRSTFPDFLTLVADTYV
jgi:hypothetical protein